MTTAAELLKACDPAGARAALTEAVRARPAVFKLRNGPAVVIDNKLAPAASLTPKPSDS